MKLIDNGLKLSALHKSLKSLRRTWPSYEKPLASMRLITDGKSVFKYDPKLDSLESLDEFGQFAFWFGLREEVETVIKELNQMPVPIRYKKKVSLSA